MGKKDKNKDKKKGKELTKKQKEIKKKKFMDKNYGHLLGAKSKDIPVEHRITSGGFAKKHGLSALRCFRMIPERDADGNKLKDKPKRRCSQPAVRGSYYCRYHGGGNTAGLKDGSTQNKRALALRGAFNGQLHEYMQAFINDPNYKDIRPELAALRTALLKYIKQLNDSKPLRDPARLIGRIKKIVNSKDKEYKNGARFIDVKKIVLNEYDLTDGKSLDRLTRIIDTISRITERAHKIEQSNEYFLTPDGLRMILRQFTDLIKKHVKDDYTLEAIADGMRNAGIQTRKRIPNRVKDADYVIKDETDKKAD